jgi:hypothetical protein
MGSPSSPFFDLASHSRCWEEVVQSSQLEIERQLCVVCSGFPWRYSRTRHPNSVLSGVHMLFAGKAENGRGGNSDPRALVRGPATPHAKSATARGLL